MKFNTINAIIVDLDRTLLHTDKSLSIYTAKILQQCKDKGIKIAVATARPLRTAKEYYEKIGFNAIVLSNGARILCDNNCKEYGISDNSATNLLRLLEERSDLRITLETGDIAYSNVPIKDYETVISNDLPYVAKNEGVHKVIVGFDYDDTLEFIKNILSDDLYYTISNGNLIQIMDTNACKWNGIKYILNKMGCKAENTAYFGDDFDDIEPIKNCGLGIAVSNAIIEVKDVAKHVTQSNDEDGVAKFIEHYILNNT